MNKAALRGFTFLSRSLSTAENHVRREQLLAMYYYYYYYYYYYHLLTTT